MTEKKKIDWNQLTGEPLAAEKPVDIPEEAVQRAIDWSLLSAPPFEKPSTDTILESVPENPSKTIDWAELTQSSEE